MQRDETHQELLVSGLNWVPETTYTSQSPFVQAEYRLGPVMLTGGLRYEHGELEVDDYVTLPTYGSRQRTRRQADHQRDAAQRRRGVGNHRRVQGVRIVFGRLYRRRYRPRPACDQHSDGQSVDNLVDLSPVVADNREIGIDYDDGRWLAHLAAYWSDSDLGSLLVRDPATNNYNVSRQKTKIEGIEANVSFRITDGSRIGLGYAHSEGRYDRNQDGRVDTDLEGINISPDRATAFWEQNWHERFSTRLQASHSFDRDFDRLGTQVAHFDGYTTLDLQARIALPVGDLNLGIENLLDEQYITYYSQTSYPPNTLTPVTDDYFAGRGRVLNVNWSHHF